MSNLPAHAPDQAYCDVSALEAGHIQVPLDWLISTAQKGEKSELPALSFLLRHSKNGDILVFDLGIRKDIENITPGYRKRIEKMGFRVSIPEDAADSLAKGGLAPTDVKHVCYSHIHFDHIGDSHPYTNATFLLGAAAQPLAAHEWPEDPESLFAQDLLPEGRTRFLDPADWAPLGPFPRALDFYGDGSLYIVDAPGHMPGHINVLARTSPDGGWIYLAGDSGHDRRLVTGEAYIPVHEVFGCAHRDREAAAEHDVPWYKINKGGPAFWPGKIDSICVIEALGTYQSDPC